MRQLLHGKGVSLVGVAALAGMLFLLAGATEVTAQFGGMGTQLEPEQLQAAWTLAARGVAHDMNLSTENTTKLVDAYIAARESYQEAVGDMTGGMGGGMPGGGMGGGMPGGGGLPGGQNQEALTAELNKLEEALKGFLSAEQVEEALESLGTFSSNWDNMLNVITGFELSDEVLDKALNLIKTYIVDSEKAMADATSGQSFQGRSSTGSQSLKIKLDGSMVGILSPAQFSTWMLETASTRGGGFPGGGF